MHPLPRRIRRLALCLAAALVCAPCAGQNPASQGATETAATRRLAILLYGFFNNEDPHAFNPEPILDADVRLRTVHASLARRAKDVAVSRPIRVLSWGELNVLYDRAIPDAEQTLVDLRFREALEVLHWAAINEPNAFDEKVEKLKAPVPPSAGLAGDDRILLVVGLETCTPGGDPHLLRSVLGCFWFSGDGPYLAGAIQPYDFSDFGTEDMITLTANCFPKHGEK